VFSCQTDILETKTLSDQKLNTHKASFRYEGFTSISDKADILANKRVVLFISVGQAYHEQGKFVATIELINKYQFEVCDIMMADTLQRYNYHGKMSTHESYLYTRQAGDAWLQRSAYALSKLTIPYTITRWDDLINHQDYAQLRMQIDDAYDRDSEYKSVVQ